VLRYFDDNDPWMIAEDIPEIFFYFCQVWLSSFVNDLEKSCGRNYKKVLSVFHGTDMKFYYGEKDSREFEEYLVEKIIDEPEFGENINKNIYLFSDKLTDFSRELANADLADVRSEQICEWIKEQDRIHTELYEWGWLSNATDMFHNTFTNRLKNFLIVITKDREKANRYLSILSAPKKRSILNDQQIELLEIIHQIQQNHSGIKKVSEEILSPTENQLLCKYWEKYHHIKFLWTGQGGAYTLEDYHNQINEFLNTGSLAQDEIKKINTEIEKTQDRKQELIKEISLDSKFQKLFEIYSEFMLTKAYRREAQIYWSYHMNNLLKETAKRLKISLGQVYFMLPNEIETALLNGKLDKNLLYERKRLCVYYVEKGKEAFLVGDEARDIEKSLEKKYEEVSELQGYTGSLGKASGCVKIINTPKDMTKMQQGDILVAIATNPDIVPAMKKAAAIVTEQGGITSHAAIVAREMNKPAVIGTKIATKVLKDGDFIEVDANNGVVRKIKK